jgi:hypothetical protein
MPCLIAPPYCVILKLETICYYGLPNLFSFAFELTFLFYSWNNLFLYRIIIVYFVLDEVKWNSLNKAANNNHA